MPKWGSMEIPLSMMFGGINENSAINGSHSEGNDREVVFVCQLLKIKEILSTRVPLFVSSRHLSFVKPNLQAAVRKERNCFNFEISSVIFTHFVEITLDGLGVIFRDNYIDLPTDQTVTFSALLPPGWSVGQVHTALCLRSTYNLYINQS